MPLNYYSTWPVLHPDTVYITFFLYTASFVSHWTNDWLGPGMPYLIFNTSFNLIPKEARVKVRNFMKSEPTLRSWRNHGNPFLCSYVYYCYKKNFFALRGVLQVFKSFATPLRRALGRVIKPPTMPLGRITCKYC